MQIQEYYRILDFPLNIMLLSEKNRLLKKWSNSNKPAANVAAVLEALFFLRCCPKQLIPIHSEIALKTISSIRLSVCPFKGITVLENLGVRVPGVILWVIFCVNISHVYGGFLEEEFHFYCMKDYQRSFNLLFSPSKSI